MHPHGPREVNGDTRTIQNNRRRARRKRALAAAAAVAVSAGAGFLLSPGSSAPSSSSARRPSSSSRRSVGGEAAGASTVAGAATRSSQSSSPGAPDAATGAAATAAARSSPPIGAVSPLGGGGGGFGFDARDGTGSVASVRMSPGAVPPAALLSRASKGTTAAAEEEEVAPLVAGVESRAVAHLRERSGRDTIRLPPPVQTALLTAPSSSIRPTGVSGTGNDGSGSRRPNRHIFKCQFRQDMIESLFPDYEGAILALDSGIIPNQHDVLLATYVQAQETCASLLPPSLGGNILHFPGRMLFWNNEAADTVGGPRPSCGPDCKVRLPNACPDTVPCVDMVGQSESRVAEFERPDGRFAYLPPSERAFVVGPHADTERSVRVHLGAKMVFQTLVETPLGQAEGALSWLLDPKDRPRNTGAHFAAFLATRCVKFRDEAAKRIAQLGMVRVGPNYAKCAAMVPDPAQGPAPEWGGVIGVSPAQDSSSASGHPFDPFGNVPYLREYKFALVMENTYREGYMTEKLVAAFRAGTVPIWYGGRDALEIFNPDALVFYDVEDPEPALARIQLLMEDKGEYRKVQEAPILKDGRRTLERYFSLRDDIGGGYLKNKIRAMMGFVEASGSIREGKETMRPDAH